LVSQLVDGDHVESSFGGSTFPDYGGTADVALALAAAGDQDAALVDVIGWLEGSVGDYADPAGSFGGPYGGAAAKLALVAAATGQDPHDFGGVDLPAIITTDVCTAATADGACSAAGDVHGAYSPVSQALAVIALTRTGSAVPAPVLARLDELQCADGGFSSTLILPGDPCTSEVDSTGFALQAIAPLASHGTQAAAATAYLLAQQEPSGGFSGAAGENANSTALAVQGLLAAGAGPAGASAVTAAQTWLEGLANADGGLRLGSAVGGSDLRATDQSVPALVGVTFATLDHPVFPSATPAPTTPAPTTPAPTTATTSPVGVAADAVELPFTDVADPSGQLAATGATVAPWLVAGVASLAVGTVVLLLARRRAGVAAR
jgi:hypothetical protein